MSANMVGLVCGMVWSSSGARCGGKPCTRYLLTKGNFEEIGRRKKRTGSCFDQKYGVCQRCWRYLPHSPFQRRWMYPKIGSRAAALVEKFDGDYYAAGGE